MIERLFAIIEDRKQKRPADSYTVRLLEGGDDLMLKKVGEETIEVILAAASQGEGRLIEEAADLIYHLLVLLASRDLHLHDVEQELRRRHKPDLPAT
jgi:phosphoribosyl-ATP pyrophosphohydrolase